MLKKNHSNRYKPLYKKFVRLRKNVQNRKKLLYGLKKKKWNPLVLFLKNKIKRRKQNFVSYDQSNHVLNKYISFYKKNYLNKLLNKKRFCLFFGGLTLKTLQKLVYISKTNKNNFNKMSSNNNLISILETKLFMVLYRAHFVTSVREAKLLIQHGHVFLNNKSITDHNILLKNGDLITISKNHFSKIKYNIYSSNLWPLIPRYLEVNYQTLQIVFLSNDFIISNIGIYYPFRLNLHNIN